MKVDQPKIQQWGFVVLRIGMAIIFFWFGTSQLMHPEMWTGFVPGWASQYFWSVEQITLINGLFETIAATLIIFNIFTRLVALVLAIHVFIIALTLGLNPIGVRDIGLSIATLSLAMLHPTKHYRA